MVTLESKTMKCLICKQGETEDGFATVTLNRDSTILVVKEVPARVCNVCGEEYLDEEVSAKLSRKADAAVKSRVEVEICYYSAATRPTTPA